MTFGKEFTTAVEQKQIAQQDAERAKFVVEKVSAFERSWLVVSWIVLINAHRCWPSLPLQAEQERQANVIRAEGEAEAAATISKALNRAGEAFVQFRRIEASKDIGESEAFRQIQRLLTRVLRSYLACWIEERDVFACG
jgi:prohibitin 1